MIKLIENKPNQKLYQWDTGREVEVSECAKVQFAPQGSSVAVSVSPVVLQDRTIAPIPDEVLQSGRPITVFLVNILADNKEVTMEAKVFPVTNRPKPKDYLPTAAEEAIGELKKITKEAEDAAAMALAAANVLIVTADTAEETVNFSAEEIYAHVRIGGDVYLNVDGEYYALLASLPTKATFMCYSDRGNTGWGNTIDFVFVESIGYWTERINYSEFAKIDNNSTGDAAWSAARILREIRENAGSSYIDETGKASGILDMDGNAVKNVAHLIIKQNGEEGVSLYPGMYEAIDGETNAAVIEFYGTYGDESVRLRNLAPGVNNEDAATVGQLNRAVGDIEAAMDAIIAIQEQLIGGEAE